MSFDLADLCAKFCSFAKVDSPGLHAQDDGTVAFNIYWRDVAVDLVAKPSSDPKHAFMLFHMGAPDPAHPDFPGILQALLKANLAALGAHQPVFSLHPETRAAILQWTLLLADIDGAELHQLICQGADLVLQWRQTYFLEPVPAANDSAPHACARGYA